MDYYITINSSNEVVSQWDLRHHEDDIKVQVAQGTYLVNMNRPWLYESGELSHPESVKTWDDVRRERNELLIRTDYVDLPSYPGSDQEDWRTYRQGLRDIPQDYTDVSDVVWPTKP